MANPSGHIRNRTPCWITVTTGDWDTQSGNRGIQGDGRLPALGWYPAAKSMNTKKTTAATPSLSTASPSIKVPRSGGAPNSPRRATTATGSVAETILPNMKDSAQFHSYLRYHGCNDSTATSARNTEFKQTCNFSRFVPGGKGMRMVIGRCLEGQGDTGSFFSSTSRAVQCVAAALWRGHISSSGATGFTQRLCTKCLRTRFTANRPLDSLCNRSRGHLRTGWICGDLKDTFPSRSYVPSTQSAGR